MQLDSSTNAGLRSPPFLAGAGACSISSVGVVAEQQLNSVQQGQVIAVFDRCIYITTSSGLFCVGVAGLGRGPLNALLESQWNCLPFNITAGEHVRLFDGQIIFDDSRIIDATNASAYHVDASFSEWTAASLQRNREALRTLVGLPADGFYWLINSVDYEQIPQGQQSALQLALYRTTSTSVLGLSNWLKLGFDSLSGLKRDNDEKTIKSVLGLLGAGPGLTPAGDDVIAGVMLALIRFQRTDLAQALWQSIRPQLAVLTNTISAAHLEQAAIGSCSESMNELLNAFFNTEPFEAATLVSSLNDMGCTSGWDTLGGVAIVVDAWHCSQNTTHRTMTTC